MILLEKEARLSPAPILRDEVVHGLAIAYIAWQKLHPAAQMTFEDYVWMNHSRVS